MLGYVKPVKGELKIKEYELYRGYYCSLCRALGKNYGNFSRLFLSYDVTFFLIFVYALKKNFSPDFRKGRCPFNPLKVCHYTSVKTDEFDFATAFSVIMTYYKIKDNISDDSFFKRIKYYVVLPFVFFKYKKAKRIHPEIDRIVSKSISEQSELEKEKCSVSDKAAHPSAVALAECFKMYSDNENTDDLFYRFGYCLGKYVYLTDAYDDIDKDKKRKNYNVFLNNNYTDEQILRSIRMCISELINCLDSFELKMNKEIINNIIRLGLDRRIEDIKNKREGDKK